MQRQSSANDLLPLELNNQSVNYDINDSIHSPTSRATKKTIFSRISPHIHNQLNKSFNHFNRQEKLDRRESVSSLKSYKQFKESNEKLHKQVDKIFNDIPSTKLVTKQEVPDKIEKEDSLAAINEQISENENSQIIGKQLAENELKNTSKALSSTFDLNEIKNFLSKESKETTLHLNNENIEMNNFDQSLSLRGNSFRNKENKSRISNKNQKLDSSKNSLSHKENIDLGRIGKKETHDQRFKSQKLERSKSGSSQIRKMGKSNLGQQVIKNNVTCSQCNKEIQYWDRSKLVNQNSRVHFGCYQKIKDQEKQNSENKPKGNKNQPREITTNRFPHSKAQFDKDRNILKEKGTQ